MVVDHEPKESRPRRRRNSLRVYRRLQIGLAIFAIGYFPAAVAIKIFGPSSGQIFPFSSWSLYTRVPNSHIDYTIKIIAVGSDRLAIPFDIHDDGPLGARGNAVWTHQIIQHMARALNSGDLETFNQFQGNLERLHLPTTSPLEYSLVERQLDPLQYLKAKTVVSERVLKTFVRGNLK